MGSDVANIIGWKLIFKRPTENDFPRFLINSPILLGSCIETLFLELFFLLQIFKGMPKMCVPGVS